MHGAAVALSELALDVRRLLQPESTAQEDLGNMPQMKHIWLSSYGVTLSRVGQMCARKPTLLRPSRNLVAMLTRHSRVLLAVHEQDLRVFV